jgi:AcrR family transcriptional regulator
MASRPPKKPRRTAQRILEVTLELFNRFGEPNVSTNLISAELGISPGNLYYHYPAKDEIINALLAEFEQALAVLLPAAPDVRDVEDAWLFFHMWFELIWRHRFLYRDLNDLLSKNRHLEQRFQAILGQKTEAIEALLASLQAGGALEAPAPTRAPLATAMVVVLTYWLSFEYVRDPRHALEPGHADQALLRGAFHVLSLLSGHLAPAQREHLQRLAQAYMP